MLILGRFTDERKPVLDALREELRKRDYLPILFDFAVPAKRDITKSVSLLARMARFVIAGLKQHPPGIASYHSSCCGARSTAAGRFVSALCNVQ